MKNQANPVFYVNYHPRPMIVRTAPMTHLAELAHRRLCDWIWAEGRAPVNDARTLASITRCLPEAWKEMRAELARNGWVGARHVFFHPEALAVLQQAKTAYAIARRTGTDGARQRWGKGPKPPPPERPGPIAPPKAPHRPPIGTPKAPHGPPIANNDKRSTSKDSRLKNKESLSGKTAERLTLSSSPPEKASGEENRFLADLALTLSDFSTKQSNLELTNWGGWWRLRFREDPGKARRVLAELGSMIREKRVRSNAGAAAKDLWERFA